MSLVTLWAWTTQETDKHSCFQHTIMSIRMATGCQMMTGAVFKPCMVGKKHAMPAYCSFNMLILQHSVGNVVKSLGMYIFILTSTRARISAVPLLIFPHSLGSRTTQPTTAPKPKPPPVPEPEPEPEPEPTEDPNVDNPGDEQCSRSLVFDAATSIRGDLYFFKTG